MSKKTERKRKALAARMKQPSLVKKILLMNAHRAKRIMEMKKRKMAQLKLKRQNKNLHHHIYNLQNITIKKVQNNMGKLKKHNTFGG